MKRFFSVQNVKFRIIRHHIFRFLIFSAAAVLFPALTTLSMTGRIPTKIYSVADSGRLIVFDDKSHYETMDMEDFLPLAVLGQLSIDSEPEVIKSFTIILRTYIVSRMDKNTKISINELNIPYTTYEELEALWGDAFPDNYLKITKLVADTSLLVMMHEGKVITPFYHSLSGGKTRDGLKNLGENFSYLGSVSCPADTEADIFEKKITYTNAEFAAQIRTIDEDISISSDVPLENVQIVERDDSGYIMSLDIGGIEVSGQSFADALGLYSPYFLIEESEDGVLITTYGLGHGYGLSLNYAASLAQGGAKYKEILYYFFNQILIAPITE